MEYISENFDIADVADSMTDILSKNIRSQEIAYSLTKEANKEEVLKHAAEKIMNAENKGETGPSVRCEFR